MSFIRTERGRYDTAPITETEFVRRRYALAEVLAIPEDYVLRLGGDLRATANEWTDPARENLIRADEFDSLVAELMPVIGKLKNFA